MGILDLVRCSRPAVMDEPPSPYASPETTEKRRRQRRSHSGADSTWKPTLGAISEDGVLLLPPAMSLPSPAKAGKNPEKGRARRTAAARRGERDYYYRHYDLPTVFPAFSPAIFMF